MLKKMQRQSAQYPEKKGLIAIYVTKRLASSRMKVTFA
jgi:hypothetical protein